MKQTEWNKQNQTEQKGMKQTESNGPKRNATNGIKRNETESNGMTENAKRRHRFDRNAKTNKRSKSGKDRSIGTAGAAVSKIRPKSSEKKISLAKVTSGYAVLKSQADRSRTVDFGLHRLRKNGSFSMNRRS